MTNELETRANAMLQELANQRGILGDRAASIAAANAVLAAENEKLKARIAELESPSKSA